MTLDGKPIGFHQFTLTSEGGHGVLESDARFDVKLLLIFGYHYRHHATEQWQGNCLEALSARTDDNGSLSQVAAKLEEHRLVVTSNGDRRTFDGCVMSFAYWNPEMLRQTRLMNPQTGRYESVHIASLPDQPLIMEGKAIPARHYRIDGSERPIELWYSINGDWLQLASTVKGGRVLLYQRVE